MLQRAAACCSVSLCCSALQCVAYEAQHYTTSDTTAETCRHDQRAGGSVLQCVAGCCSGLQCVALCCSVLQCVAACCSALQCVAYEARHFKNSDTTAETCCRDQRAGGSVLQRVAGCCSVLHCIAACCSVLQCVAYEAQHFKISEIPQKHDSMTKELVVFLFQRSIFFPAVDSSRLAVYTNTVNVPLLLIDFHIK